MIDFWVHFVSILLSQKTNEYSGRACTSTDGGNIEYNDFLDTGEYIDKPCISIYGSMSIEWLIVQSLQIH